MNKRNFLIQESLKKKLKSKWFKFINISMFILIILTLNIGTIINFFGGEFQQDKNIYIIEDLGIYDDFNTEFENIKSFSSSLLTIHKATESLDELKEKSLSDNNLIIVNIERDETNLFHAEIISNSNISAINQSIITNILNKIKRNRIVEVIGITKEDYQRVTKEVDIKTILLTKTETEIKEEKQAATTYNVIGAVVTVAFTLPFFFLIVSLVQMIGAEINEEKSSKSMEIIISNVPPKDHLIAKIISCTVFTLLQIGLIAVFVFIANLIRKTLGANDTNATRLVATAFDEIITKDVIRLLLNVLPILIVFFIATLITYAIIAGVLASMTTNIDDFQQLQTPLMMIVLIGFYLAIAAIIFDGSTFIKIVSFVPLISLLISPALFMLGQISLWSVAIAALIQILFTIFVFKYGMKVYRVGILNYSGEHLWSKIWKAIKS